jgi:putative tricarboxylic transport membrane protein
LTGPRDPTGAADRLGGAALLAFCTGYGALIGRIPVLPLQEGAAFTARTLPTFLAACGVVLSAWLLLAPARRPLPDVEGTGVLRVLLFLALMSAYGLALPLGGFLPASAAFLGLGFLLLGGRPGPAAALALLVPLAFWLLLTAGLGVYLPAGPAGR